MWPNTWMTVKVCETGECVKVRSSNIMRLDEFQFQQKDPERVIAQMRDKMWVLYPP